MASTGPHFFGFVQGATPVDWFEILNDVVLNQVLVRYRDGATTDALVERIQADGRIWCGPTRWQGDTALRISVSSWKTDIPAAQRAADVIVECAASLEG